MLANMRFEHKVEGTQKKALHFLKFPSINLRWGTETSTQTNFKNTKNH